MVKRVWLVLGVGVAVVALTLMGFLKAEVERPKEDRPIS